MADNLTMLRLIAQRLLKRILDNPAMAPGLILKQQPVIAELLRRAIVASSLDSAKQIAAQLNLPTKPPVNPAVLPGDPWLRFPGIEAAVQYLDRRQLVTKSELLALDESARKSAFTIARVASQDAISEIRDAISEDVARGGTLKTFRQRIANAVSGSGLGESAIEAIYRTNVGHAQAAGQRAILKHPLVADEFPYLLWSATHDGRVRKEHLAMESHGQNGTAVYRADDPMWKILYPPAGWNCRCVAIPLTLEDAAAQGSAEAARWLRTGVPPERPVFARVPYPITLPPDWPTHQGITAIV